MFLLDALYIWGCKHQYYRWPVMSLDTGLCSKSSWGCWVAVALLMMLLGPAIRFLVRCMLVLEVGRGATDTDCSAWRLVPTLQQSLTAVSSCHWPQLRGRSSPSQPLPLLIVSCSGEMLTDNLKLHSYLLTFEYIRISKWRITPTTPDMNYTIAKIQLISR